jgi:hypothetical protein
MTILDITTLIVPNVPYKVKNEDKYSKYWKNGNTKYFRFYEKLTSLFHKIKTYAFLFNTYYFKENVISLKGLNLLPQMR